jgi:CBS domain-containing protein
MGLKKRFNRIFASKEKTKKKGKKPAKASEITSMIEYYQSKRKALRKKPSGNLKSKAKPIQKSIKRVAANVKPPGKLQKNIDKKINNPPKENLGHAKSRKKIEAKKEMKKTSMPVKIKPTKKELAEKDKETKKIDIGIVRIKDVMTTDPKTLDERDTLGAAAELLSREKIGAAPVMSGKKLIGVISKSDILNMLGKDGIDVKDVKMLRQTNVADVMKKPITIDENENLKQAVKLMNKFNIENLFVLNKNKIMTGLVTRTDLLRGIMGIFFDIIQRSVGATIETDIDKILHMVTAEVSIDKIAKETGMKEDHIEELAKILEDHGLIEIEYPPIGKPVLRRIK